METVDEEATSGTSWKVRPGTDVHIEYTPFAHARQFFAVDASGSTYGTIIEREHEFVKRLANGSKDMASTWGSYCNTPESDLDKITWRADMGGTSPSAILKHPGVLSTILGADVWYLLTDGRIYESDVPVLVREASESGAVNVPVVFVITGVKAHRPTSLDVSVGISFFANASDVLVLFKDETTSHIYVLAAKGLFAPLAVNGNGSEPDLSSWDLVKKLDSEQDFVDFCEINNLKIPTAESRPNGPGSLVDLGEQWRMQNAGASADIALLLEPELELKWHDIEALLAEEAFNNLAVACKTRNRIHDLRRLLQSKKVEELNVKLEDIAGAAEIVACLADPAVQGTARAHHQQQLREAHATNRCYYQAALRDVEQSPKTHQMRKQNRLINDALFHLADLERSTYTADILGRSSNRAKRATAIEPGKEMLISSLDLETPIAFRGKCHLCCGDNEVISIVVKQGADSAANTDNFALDFPLAAGRSEFNQELISSQHICFQCALSLGKQSLWREKLAAIIPTLDYTDINKRYIQEQMFFGLTGGLRTGASGVSQLFMTIIDGVLSKKPWAGAHGQDPNDPEVVQRRAMLQWMLDNMLSKTGCRETFNEQGRWVTYPEALRWTAQDFAANGVDSWVVGYPLPGFNQLLKFGLKTGALNEANLHEMRRAKVLHGIASAYLARLFENAQSRDQSWRQPLLAIIYERFNAVGIPVDQRGEGSLVNNPSDFWQRLSAFLTADTELLDLCDPEDRLALMRRAQLLAFWLIYHQSAHTRAKTFFTNLRNNEPLARFVLSASDATIADAVASPVLLSIFCTNNPADHAFYARHSGFAPFVTPFGNSVLRCCFPACGDWFIDPKQLPDVAETWTLRQLDEIRQARAAHLIKAFGTDARFAKEAQTGMPIPAEGTIPPASTHVNLHISIVRVWCRWELEKRKTLADGDSDALAAFAVEVREEVCVGRRGDVYRDGLEDRVRAVLPSFFEVLGVALKREGREDGVEAFVHSFDANKLENKAKWELQGASIREDWVTL
ncbi:hypothetical protein C1H76_6313 [Elsinoe australis]|uniref:Uncharacterized protein n=1 Tax=Elsinoe australis TaxID=40998 RepID=A0A4U7AZE8_9PEZI|nr:hypothetical protein C1H76_6313 [Elsinoe australis]